MTILPSGVQFVHWVGMVTSQSWELDTGSGMADHHLQPSKVDPYPHIPV